MFGLMQFKGCQKTDEELYRRRLLYCGTCKAIGSSYGQSARMLLNNDVVFLGEVLQAISTEGTARIEDWAPAFQSYNCMSLPTEAEVPLTLRIAAAVSMILSELKFEDHIDDGGSIVVRGAKRCLDPVFTKSESEFSLLKFPMEDIRNWFEQQSIREKFGRGPATADDSLTMFAEPTAMITAIVFEHSGSIVSGDTWKPTMKRLGYGFGSLIYLIDAFEDYEKDFRTSSFNAIASAFELTSPKMPLAIEEGIERKIRLMLKELDTCIEELPLSADQKQEYSQRLWRNVRRKTGFQLHTHSSKHVHSKICQNHVSNNLPSCNNTESSLHSRWQTARSTASNLTSDIMTLCDSKVIRPFQITYSATIYLFVLLIAFLSPVQSRSLRSYRECVELPFNLMFWGAAATTLISSFTQAGNKSFAYAHAMVGGGKENDPQAFREPSPRLNAGSSEDSNVGEEPEPQDGADEESNDQDQQQNKPRRGINNDQFRRSRAMQSNTTYCFCCDTNCGGACCEGGDCCCEGCECCGDAAAFDCCTGGECCAGGCECCSGSGGSLECCAGTDCCAGGCECCTGGGGECCSGGLDCCAGGDACAGGCDCCGACFS